MASLQSIRSWDDAEADIVIVGFGLAGAVTAIEARDRDPTASILILEKMPPKYAGGNSRASGQDMFVGNNVERLMVHQRALNEPNPVPEDVLRDTVVLAMGNQTEASLYFALKGRVEALHRIGDCLAPRQLDSAILDGERIGRTL